MAKNAEIREISAVRTPRTRPEKMAAIFRAAVDWGGPWSYFMDTARALIAMRKIKTPNGEIDRFLHAKYGEAWRMGWEDPEEWEGHAAFCFQRFDEL